MHPSLIYYEVKRDLELGTFVVFGSLENNDFIVISPPISEVLWNYTKLIDKKLKRYSCTMKQSLIYINTNVELVQKFKTTLKIICFSI